MEPASIVGAAASVVSKAEKSEGLIKRVLGPPADAIGQMLARYVDVRFENVGRIIENADRKLGDAADEPGAVPLRVAGRILEEGSYCDDEMMVEYLGGVLASSRSGIARDDRAAALVSLVTQMSVYELRLHYVTYPRHVTSI